MDDLTPICQMKDLPLGGSTTCMRESLEPGNILSDEIAEAHQKKWQTLIESTDFTHSSRKAWKLLTVEGLRAT